MQDYRLQRGLMEPDLLARILRKATSECRVERCSLFSWGEPLLNPRMPELIRTVREAGVVSYLSSNLNILPNADAIMAENPDNFRISLSGFSQEVYGYYHRGGDIEKVKTHMVELAEARKRHNATTRIYVYYHRYRDNLREELLMRKFAAGLGFEFQPVWALFFPLEKILSYAGEEDGLFAVTGEDLRLIERLAVPLDKALKAGRLHREKPCPLRDQALSLDCRGAVQLCCGVFDPRQFSIGNYLDIPLDEIQQIRQGHPMCGRCMAQGIHRYLIHGFQELSELALERISPEDAELLDLRREIARMRMRQRAARIYDAAFSGILSEKARTALAERYFRLERLISRFSRDKRMNRK
jgi:hypothetical protein